MQTPPHLRVLQAASSVLNKKKPDRRSVKILADYATANLPQRANLPPDELATVVALNLLDIPADKL